MYSQPNRRRTASPVTWPHVLADAASESLAESVVDGQNIKTTFDLGREGDAPRSEQNRLPEAGVETGQLRIR